MDDFVIPKQKEEERKKIRHRSNDLTARELWLEERKCPNPRSLAKL